MSKQTAAEKFDLVPPWCEVKKGECDWGVASHDGTKVVYDTYYGTWHAGQVSGGWIESESKARRIARLTRPLDSWEPAPDCPLPVKGWRVSTHIRGDAGLYDADGMYAGGSTAVFPTRRDAYIWAWTEATAPDEAKEDRVEPVRDGKGRTLEVIDAALDEVIGAINQQADTLRRIRKRLVAGTVGKDATPTTRHDAASANEPATDVAAAQPSHRWGCKVGKAANGWWLVTDATEGWWLRSDLKWGQGVCPAAMWQIGTLLTEAKALDQLARATFAPPTYTPPVEDAATERAAVLAKIPSRYVIAGASLADAVGNLAAACDAALRERDEWMRRAQEAEATLREVREWIEGKVK